MNNYCRGCEKYKHCIKICPELQKHLKEDIEVAQQHKLVKSNIEEVIAEEWPEGIYELDQKDWAHFIRKYKLTEKQRSYFYDYYWLGLSYKQISKKHGVSIQNVCITTDLARKNLSENYSIS